MTFLDKEMKEIGKNIQQNIHNTRSFIRALRYFTEILQTEEVFTVEEYMHTHTKTHAHTHAHTHVHAHTNVSTVLFTQKHTITPIAASLRSLFFGMYE